MKQSYFQFLKKKYRESLELLTSWSNETRDATYYNNAACIVLQMGLTDASILLFRKGMQIIEAGRGTERRGVHCKLPFSHASCQLIYNCGVALLKLNQPMNAFKCFERVSRFYRRFPGLWIRLAECCVHHEVIIRCKEENKHKSPVQSTLSHGEFRRLVIRFGVDNKLR